MAQTRDLNAERESLKTFGDKYGRMPKTPDEWAKLSVMTYGYDTPEDMAEDVKVAVEASKPAAGVQTATGVPPPQGSTAGAQEGRLGELGTNVDTARAAYQQFTEPTYTQKTLEDAIRTKTGAAAAPIGESEIFKKAGLGGMGALAYSLNARKQELSANATTFENTIKDMVGMYRDQGANLLEGYKTTIDEYNEEADRFDAREKQLFDYKMAMDLVEARSAADQALERYKAKLEADSTVTTGGVNVGGYDISSYATDPQHEIKIQNILSNIGKFDTIQAVDSYIKQVAPNSPITGQMISETSAKYKIPWEMLVAMMQQDSSLGTAGIGARTMNPGNVGNTDEVVAAGGSRSYPSWQAGVDAVGDWLSRHEATGEAVYKPISNLSKEELSWLNTVQDNARTDDAIKMFNTVRASYEQGKAAAQQNSSQGDIVLMRTIAKVTDPTSSVREEEFRTFEGAQGILAQYGITLTKKMWGKGALTEYGRQGMLTTLNDIYAQRKGAYDNSMKFFGKQLSERGIDPSLAAPYYVAPEEGEFSITAPDGNTYSFSSQEDLDNFKREANIQ